MSVKKVATILVFGFFVTALVLPAVGEAQQPFRKARENLINLWLLKMTQVLNLNQEQTAKIYPAVFRTEEEKRELQMKIGKKLRELKMALVSEKTDEQLLTKLMKEIKMLRNEVRAKDDELEAFIEKNLSLEQRAKYMVFATEFMKGMRERLMKERMKQQRIPQRRKF
ncbi:MAG: hypothetical protein ACE5LC_03790 [Candidatus Aminicenantales bacterium]